MVSLAELQAAAAEGLAALDALLLPVAAGVAHLPSVRLDEAESQAVAQGRSLQGDFMPAAHTAVFAADGRLLALAEVDAAHRLKVLRGFNLPSVALQIEAP
jgi:tRNA pseudouridine55 synthase